LELIRVGYDSSFSFGFKTLQNRSGTRLNASGVVFALILHVEMVEAILQSGISTHSGFGFMISDSSLASPLGKYISELGKTQSEQPTSLGKSIPIPYYWMTVVITNRKYPVPVPIEITTCVQDHVHWIRVQIPCTIEASKRNLLERGTIS